MMASPSMLEEFALGFSLAQGIIPDASHLYACEVREACRGGIEVDLTISSECFWKLKDRRRSMTGRTGAASAASKSGEAVRESGSCRTSRPSRWAADADALGYLERVERLGGITGRTHAAVWVRPDGALRAAPKTSAGMSRLDKLLGLRARRGWRDGALVISSRASYEMVQKAAMCGVEIIFAVSAPTALAVELARECGITLAAFCRRSRAERLLPSRAPHWALREKGRRRNKLSWNAFRFFLFLRKAF